MTKEQVIELAISKFGWSIAKMWHRQFVEFATLVRNDTVIKERKALAELCDAMGSPNIAEYLRSQVAAIESLKEPTP